MPSDPRFFDKQGNRFRSAVSARSMTFGDSAMNRPCWVQAVAKLDFREFVYADTRSSSMESRWMNCM